MSKVKLFKKDTKGNIRFLEVEAKDGKLIRVSGIVGTDKPIRDEKDCKPKNIGKKNETTKEEQAKKEAASLIETKLDEGYFPTLEQASEVPVILPMLAKDYKKESHKVDYSKPVYAQPKLDGMRALLMENKLISRKGKEIDTMSHIVNEASRTGSILDGEIYAHGYNFQENMEMIKKYTKGITEKVQYHVYDLVANQPFHERYTSLVKLVADMENVHIVPTILIKNEKDLKKAHKKFLSLGYEGTIVRHGDDDYMVNGRSSSLLKYKDFIDIACPIIDIIPCNKRPKWGKPVLDLGNGKTFEANMRYSHSQRIEFLENKKEYIGKTAEIRFFEYSNTGIPRFPVMHGIRLDK